MTTTRTSRHETPQLRPGRSREETMERILARLIDSVRWHHYGGTDGEWVVERELPFEWKGTLLSNETVSYLIVEAERLAEYDARARYEDQCAEAAWEREQNAREVA